MKIWFTRSNGNTKHNNPTTSRFVVGEPPVYPETDFNYRTTCLSSGFARIGWPATGDLRQPAWRETGRAAYSAEEFGDRQQAYLEKFRSIATGDVVLIPADRDEYDVHIGVVALRRSPDRQVTSLRPDLPAYYYRHDVSCSDWFENAHRVDVVWDRNVQGEFGVHRIADLGGIWRRAFSAVVEGDRAARELAGTLGLIRAGS